MSYRAKGTAQGFGKSGFARIQYGKRAEGPFILQHRTALGTAQRVCGLEAAVGKILNSTRDRRGSNPQ